MTQEHNSRLLRRSFLGRISAAVAAFGAGGATAAAAQPEARRFEPARHGDDDWFDAIPGRHRLLLDAVTGAGAGDALLFAGNFLNTNKSGYGLADADSAVVVCLRHFATPFAWTDAVWAKYGSAFTEFVKVNDPKSGGAPSINLYRSREHGRQLNNLGTTIDDLIKRGVQFAVCDAATHFAASAVARATKASADALYTEFKASTIPSARYVVSGIVAVNRAQERGYTVAACG